MKGAAILVVEDEAVVVLDLQGRLKRLGYAVTATAISGREAVELAGKTRPDLIFMDIGLRGAMDGIEAAKQIRAQSSIPIVFLTAYADAKTRERAEAVPPAAFLAKPFADDELLEAIRLALSEETSGQC